ncbi:MAG: hypothetical protein AABX23_05325 [Nanoarchaeota archaeon]
MIKEITLKIIILILSVTVLGVFFQTDNDENPSLIEKISAGPLSAPVGNSSKPCGYNNITTVFQNHGMPARSSIEEIEKVDPRHISLFIYNRILNKTELYIYDIGNDSLLNTQDDRGFLIDSIYGNETYIHPIISAPNINTINSTLYWVKPIKSGKKEIKSCTLTSQGCTNTRILSTISRYIKLQSIAPTVTQNRIHIAYEDVYDVPTIPIPRTSSYVSCSLQPGTRDNCNGKIEDFVVHSSYRYLFYRNLRNIGFASTVEPDPGNETYIFDINLPNPRIVSLPIGLDIDSIHSLGYPPTLMAIYQDYINPNSIESIAVADVNMGTITTLDSLDYTLSDQGYYPDLVDLPSPGNLVVVYNSNSGLIAEKPLLPAKIISNRVDIAPKAVFSDSSILGFMSGRSTVVKFDCSP